MKVQKQRVETQRLEYCMIHAAGCMLHTCHFSCASRSSCCRSFSAASAAFASSLLQPCERQMHACMHAHTQAWWHTNRASQLEPPRLLIAHMSIHMSTHISIRMSMHTLYTPTEFCSSLEPPSLFIARRDFLFLPVPACMRLCMCRCTGRHVAGCGESFFCLFLHVWCGRPKVFFCVCGVAGLKRIPAATIAPTGLPRLASAAGPPVARGRVYKHACTHACGCMCGYMCASMRARMH